MNIMDLLSTLWVIGNLKTRSNKHNHNSHKSKFHQPNRWKNDRRNERNNKSARSYTKSRSPDKTTTIMTSTLPHSNRRKNRRSYHILKTTHVYSVENEIQAKNHLPASNLEQGWVIDSGDSAHIDRKSTRLNSSHP